MSGGDLLLADASARETALALDSFIVEAPAGAGKTELLTQRFLRLLAVVDEPEELVAITFTNKAAAEMRARILDSLALEEAAGLPPHRRITFDLAGAARARDAARDWGIRGNPGRLRVTTIDALCASLARQMPLLSRFGAQPAVADDAAALYESAARAALDLLESEGAEAATIIEALRYFDNDAARLEALLVAMLKRRDQWMSHVSGQQWQDAAALSLLVAGDLARAAEALDDSLQAELMPAARYAAAHLDEGESPIRALAEWDRPLLGRPEELDGWRAIACLLLTGTGSLRKAFDKRIGIPAGKESKPVKETLEALCESLRRRPGAEAALARIQEIPGAALDADEARIVAVFAHLLKIAAAQLWLVFQQRQQVDYIEIAQRALLALGDDETPSDLQLKLDYRISHLLVDEFQDTSPTQMALLERLTAGWTPGDGRTLFAVGDPMQSIYRFRKADVGLFLQARLSGIGRVSLQALRLNRNNRSHPELVDWINATFAGVFPEADNPQRGAVRFAPSVATKAVDPSAGVRVHPLLTTRDANDAQLLEARQVIAILRRAREAAPHHSIAILVRARSHLEALAAEMRRAGADLPYQAVEIESLAGRQPVQDLLALTLALHHRGDRLNWLAILRAPWCGLLLADLHALAADDQRSTIWQLLNDDARLARLSFDGRRRLLHLRGVCAEAFAHQGRQPLRRWVEAAWRMLGGESCLRSSADMLDVQAYFRLLDTLDESGGFLPQHMQQEVDSLFAAADPVPNAIQMMTIHKSKGLEFDTVILPGLHRIVRGNDTGLLVWEEFVDGAGREHLVAAPLRRRGRAAKQPTAYDYLKAIETGRGANEDRRVLYVAATRARHGLHLVGVAAVEQGADGPSLRQPKQGSALAALWPGIGGDFKAALDGWRPAASANMLDAAGFTPSLLRLAVGELDAVAAKYQADTPDEFPAPAPSTGEQAGPPDGGDDEEAGLFGLQTDVGILAHRMLELIAADGLALWNRQRIRDTGPALRRWLENRGHSPALLDTATGQVVHAVSGAVASEAGRWILEPRPGEANELALTDVREAKIRAHVIDRSFVEHGERWIIDYKSTQFAAGADSPSPELLRAKAETWRGQLERYAALFADEGLPIRMAIFFLACGQLVELPARAA